MHSFDSELYIFVTERMRMRTDGQPFVIRVLLRRGGSASEMELVEKYRKETQLPDSRAKQRIREALKTLSTHGVVRKDRVRVSLTSYDRVSAAERDRIDQICTRKLKQWRESH